MAQGQTGVPDKVTGNTLLASEFTVIKQAVEAGGRIILEA